MDMINNIFSIFDPSSSLFSLRWFIIAPTIAISKTLTFRQSNKSIKLINSIIVGMSVELKQLIEKKTNMSTSIITKLFIIVFFLNIIAIFPFNFTPTAHISVSVSLSLSMWASIIIFGWLKNFKNSIAHLTPTGTPPNLMNFIVIIETTRIMIRPITLSIRLSANMVAGHLLISLLSSFSLSNYFNACVSSIFILTLIPLETIVALVQAYVITTLLTLYQNETY